MWGAGCADRSPAARWAPAHLHVVDGAQLVRLARLELLAQGPLLPLDLALPLGVRPHEQLREQRARGRRRGRQRKDAVVVVGAHAVVVAGHEERPKRDGGRQLSVHLLHAEDLGADARLRSRRR